MDDIILRCAARHVVGVNNIRYCEVEIVKRTYGFEYDKHFRFMLIKLLGIINVEYIETHVDQPKYDSMKAALASLKTQRDTEAHTHVKGLGKTLNAPSVTMGQFPIIYDGLLEFDSLIRKDKW
jgi:hypothetical protein